MNSLEQLTLDFARLVAGYPDAAFFGANLHNATAVRLGRLLPHSDFWELLPDYPNDWNATIGAIEARGMAWTAWMQFHGSGEAYRDARVGFNYHGRGELKEPPCTALMRAAQPCICRKQSLTRYVGTTEHRLRICDRSDLGRRGKSRRGWLRKGLKYEDNCMKPNEDLSSEEMRLVRRFFLRRGELIPLNEEEVELFEASQGKQNIELPEVLLDFNKLLARGKKNCPYIGPSKKKVIRDREVDENLARAAREGQEIPAEILEPPCTALMRAAVEAAKAGEK